MKKDEKKKKKNMAVEVIDVSVDDSVKVVNSGVNVLVETVVSVDDNQMEVPGMSVKVDETLVVSIDSVVEVSIDEYFF